jgi:hypothetical protein
MFVDVVIPIQLRKGVENAADGLAEHICRFVEQYVDPTDKELSRSG